MNALYFEYIRIYIDGGEGGDWGSASGATEPSRLNTFYISAEERTFI